MANLDELKGRLLPWFGSVIATRFSKISEALSHLSLS
jgi:hypothetical protein